MELAPPLIGKGPLYDRRRVKKALPPVAGNLTVLKTDNPMTRTSTGGISNSLNYGRAVLPARRE